MHDDLIKCLMSMKRYMDPLTYGNYPNNMRTLVGGRLPKFTPQQSMLLKGSFDFIGLNYYTANYAADVPLPVSNNVNVSYSTDSLANLTSKLIYTNPHIVIHTNPLVLCYIINISSLLLFFLNSTSRRNPHWSHGMRAKKFVANLKYLLMNINAVRGDIICQ